jgi:hypothetical protein
LRVQTSLETDELSGCPNRFSINQTIAIGCKQAQKASNLWHYLKLSVTPKVHLVEAHAMGLCEKHNGFGGLDKDEGK